MSPTMPGEPLALDFKSATLYAVRVVLHSADTDGLTAALDQRMAEAGSFFENEPVVIDAGRLDTSPDWPALLAALRERNLPPIGVVAAGAVLEAAVAAGLTPVELSTPAARPAPSVAAAAAAASGAPQLAVPDAAGDAPAVAEPGQAGPEQGGAGAAADGAAEPGNKDPGKARKGEPADAGQPEAGADGAAAQDAAQATARSADAPPAAVPALVVTRPLRSGQRIYARHTDLIVIGMVSQGAEVIADGNIHVYGPLRGKAMAGARGDVSARIFTTQLDAELLAIAGVYRVVEDKLPAPVHNRPVQVRLDNDTLLLDPLHN